MNLPRLIHFDSGQNWHSPDTRRTYSKGQVGIHVELKVE